MNVVDFAKATLLFAALPILACGSSSDGSSERIGSSSEALTVQTPQPTGATSCQGASVAALTTRTPAGVPLGTSVIASCENQLRVRISTDNGTTWAADAGSSFVQMFLPDTGWTTGPVDQVTTLATGFPNIAIQFYALG